VGSVGLLGAGRLLDLIDLRWFAIGTSVLVAAGCWFLSSVTTVIGLFAAIFLVRFTAQSLWGVCAQVSMARYFDDERGKAAAVSNTGYALGYAIFPLIGAWLLASFGWREAWELTAWCVLLGIVPLIVFQLWGHGTRHKAYEEKLADLESANTGSDTQQWAMGEVLRDTRFWLLQPAMVVVPSVVFSIQFHQLYLIESKGWSLTAFASSYSLYAVISLVAGLVGGSFVDRHGSHRLMTYALWPLVPALAALAWLEAPITIAIVMSLTGLTFGLSLVVFITIWAELYGTKHMGAIRSFNTFFNVAMASAVMVLTGLLIDWGVSVAAMCIGGVVLVGISLILLTQLRIKPPTAKPQVT
jgi:sugar phosphate permease